MIAWQENIEDEMRKGNLPGMDYVVKILGRGMDVESERNKIEKFRIDFRVLTNEVQGLQKKLGAASFDLQKYEEEEKAWKASEIKLKEINEKVIGRRKDLIRQEKEMNEKKEVVKKEEERKSVE